MSDAWVRQAVNAIEADFNRSADTHLFRIPVPGVPGIDLYFKDESVHPTGSLKHRLARSLVLYGLCNGDIHEGTTLVEASSGSTAISEAWFAQLLGLPFVAVIPRATSHEKIAQIEFHGGRCHYVDDPAAVYGEAERLAAETRGHYLDQFSKSERVTDWRGNNNIAETIFQQMTKEPHPIPRWIVCGAGTGGTSATIARFIRYRKLTTEMCVVDPENSVFFDYYRTGNRELRTCEASRVEGVGRPRVEPSFQRQIIDRMILVPDQASIAAIHFLRTTTGLWCGGSTGTNLIGAFSLMAMMRERGETGSVVMLMCDGGGRYADTYFDDDWLSSHGFVLSDWLDRLDAFHRRGVWDCQLSCHAERP